MPAAIGSGRQDGLGTPGARQWVRAMFPPWGKKGRETSRARSPPRRRASRTREGAGRLVGEVYRARDTGLAVSTGRRRRRGRWRRGGFWRSRFPSRRAFPHEGGGDVVDRLPRCARTTGTVGGKTSGKEEQHGTNRYDVAIIGAGSAGLSALREVRLRTTNCILINDGIAERRARVSAACHRKVLDRDRQDVL